MNDPDVQFDAPLYSGIGFPSVKEANVEDPF